MLRPVFAQVHSLPDSWRFTRYSLADVRYVFEFIVSIAYIHWVARNIAMRRDCVGLGYIASVYVTTKQELLSRMEKDSEISRQTVNEILDDLTYGTGGITHPDPAIQPLIHLSWSNMR